jgi:hypothetical protein
LTGKKQTAGNASRVEPFCLSDRPEIIAVLALVPECVKPRSE